VNPSRLLRVIRREPPGVAPTFRLRWGTVTAVGSATVTVDLGGTSIAGIPRLASYSPSVGDHVAIFANGTDYVAAGTLA
jgi:hypothetical protein